VGQTRNKEVEKRPDLQMGARKDIKKERMAKIRRGNEKARVSERQQIEEREGKGLEQEEDLAIQN